MLSTRLDEHLEIASRGTESLLGNWTRREFVASARPPARRGSGDLTAKEYRSPLQVRVKSQLASC